MICQSDLQELEKELEQYKIVIGYDDYYIGIDKNTNQRVSIKQIPNILNFRYGPTKIYREIKICSALDHENITHLINIKAKSHYKKFDSIVLISEILDTDLCQIIKSSQELTEDHRRFFMYQILRALKYLHSANIIHKNIRPSNVLLAANCDLKLQTLGFEDFIFRDYIPCHSYNSPEQLLNDLCVTSGDIWSVGCIFYEIIMRSQLFPNESTLRHLSNVTNTIGIPKDDDLYYLKNIKAKRFMNSLPKKEAVNCNQLISKGTNDEIDLIKQMLVWNPSKRISADEALKHPYFELLHDPSDEPCSSLIDIIDTETIGQSEGKKLLWEEVQKIRKIKNM